jgi:hypothetical protein
MRWQLLQTTIPKKGNDGNKTEKRDFISAIKGK